MKKKSSAGKVEFFPIFHKRRSDILHSEMLDVLLRARVLFKLWGEKDMLTSTFSSFICKSLSNSSSGCHKLSFQPSSTSIVPIFFVKQEEGQPGGDCHE